jgi:hypothetical protein
LRKQYRNIPENKKKRAQFRKDNLHIFRRYQSTRRARIYTATPKWMNIVKVQDIYKEAVELEYITGIEFHVDHIIPLNHKLVCGLHCEDNLQILTSYENMKKYNTFEVI